MFQPRQRQEVGWYGGWQVGRRQRCYKVFSIAYWEGQMEGRHTQLLTQAGKGREVLSERGREGGKVVEG